MMFVDDEFSLFTSLRYDESLTQVPTRDMEFAGWNHRHESSLYMLDFHRDRMLHAATHWKWTPAINVLSGKQGLNNLAKKAEGFLDTEHGGPFRLKIVVSRDGAVSFEKSPTPVMPLENLFPLLLPPPGTSLGQDDPQKSPMFTLVVDHLSTPSSEYTHFKTTKRAMYDAARQRANISLSALQIGRKS
jgi:4-amino-4-deoxychorismate lyase